MATGQLIDPNASSRMLHILASQRIDDLLPALLPSSVGVAHKTGDLESVVNDAGVIYGPEGRFILVVLAHETIPGQAADAQTRLARQLYDLVLVRPIETVDAPEFLQ